MSTNNGRMNTERSAFAPPPNLVYGLEHGKNNRQNALKISS